MAPTEITFVPSFSDDRDDLFDVPPQSPRQQSTSRAKDRYRRALKPTLAVERGRFGGSRFRDPVSPKKKESSKDEENELDEETTSARRSRTRRSNPWDADYEDSAVDPIWDELKKSAFRGGRGVRRERVPEEKQQHPIDALGTAMYASVQKMIGYPIEDALYPSISKRIGCTAEIVLCEPGEENNEVSVSVEEMPSEPKERQGLEYDPVMYPSVQRLIGYPTEHAMYPSIQNLIGNIVEKLVFITEKSDMNKLATPASPVLPQGTEKEKEGAASPATEASTVTMDTFSTAPSPLPPTIITLQSVATPALETLPMATDELDTPLSPLPPKVTPLQSVASPALETLPMATDELDTPLKKFALEGIEKESVATPATEASSVVMYECDTPLKTLPFEGIKKESVATPATEASSVVTYECDTPLKTLPFEGTKKESVATPAMTSSSVVSISPIVTVPTQGNAPPSNSRSKKATPLVVAAHGRFRSPTGMVVGNGTRRRATSGRNTVTPFVSSRRSAGAQLKPREIFVTEDKKEEVAKEKSRIVQLAPLPLSHSSSLDSTISVLSPKEESLLHAHKAGIVWQTLVGQHMKLPDDWFDGSRTPSMGVEGPITKEDKVTLTHPWSYISKKRFYENEILDDILLDRLCPGKVLLHIVVRKDGNSRPIEDIVVGCYHSHAPAFGLANSEECRTLWMAVRKRADRWSRVIPLLTLGHDLAKVSKKSPLESEKRLTNNCLKAVFGDDPPVETIFITENRLFNSIKNETGKLYAEEPEMSLVLLELFLRCQIEC